MSEHIQFFENQIEKYAVKNVGESEMIQTAVQDQIQLFKLNPSFQESFLNTDFQNTVVQNAMGPEVVQNAVAPEVLEILTEIVKISF